MDFTEEEVEILLYYYNHVFVLLFVQSLKK